MPDLDSRGLITIGRVLGPVGGTMGPKSVDFSSPMPVVFDASRIAEAASGAGNPFAPGYILHTVDMIHAAADVRRNMFNPYTDVPIHAVVPEEFDIWLLDIFSFSISTAVANTANAAIFYPAYMPGTTGIVTLQLLWATTGTLAVSDITATGDNGVTTGVTPYRAQLPLFVPVGSIISMQTLSNNAGTSRMVFKLWVGPKGVRPPGVA